MARRTHSESISACIIAGNEEENIERCLRSVQWADEIVVVDSFSKDRTVDIARRYTDRVYQHKWLGYIGQKQLIKDLAKGPWVMFVDADEEVSPALQAEIEAWFSNPVPPEIAGFEFPRLVRYLDRWVRHGDWYPDIKLRLFRKDRATCGGKEPHDRVFVQGQVRRLLGCLHHYTYSDIHDQIDTLNRFSRISAGTRQAEGHRFRLSDILFRPMFRFIRGYFFKLGILDGLPGFIIAVNVAFGTFIKYAKLWEAEHQQRLTATPPAAPPPAPPSTETT